MAEQEIDLNSGAPISSPTSAAPVEREINDKALAENRAIEEKDSFNAAAPNKEVSGKLASASSNEDLLNQIIATPVDNLIPWEEVILPSKGLYYNGQIPGGIVKIKAMGTQADKILATARLAQTGQSIDYLLDNQVQLPNGFPPNDLLAGDRTYLLYVLRGITHGNAYEFMIDCPNCEAKNSTVYDLNLLSDTLTLGNPSISEPHKVVLPYLSSTAGKEVWVGVRFMRGKDISTLAQRQRFNKRIAGPTARNASQPTQQGRPRREAPKVAIDQTLTENLNLVVVNFMGNVVDPMKIKQLVENLHSSDTAAIRDFLKTYSPGIDTTIELECIDCGTKFKTDLPITESFFRPSKS